MADVQFDDVVELALQLSPAERARLVERLTAEMQTVLTDEEPLNEQPFTDAEVAEMFKIQPMTGAEIVAAGLLGGWSHLDIADGAEWVNEQKRKRRNSA